VSFTSLVIEIEHRERHGLPLAVGPRELLEQDLDDPIVVPRAGERIVRRGLLRGPLPPAS
jgi:hypothetical protein